MGIGLHLTNMNASRILYAPKTRNALSYLVTERMFGKDGCNRRHDGQVGDAVGRHRLQQQLQLELGHRREGTLPGEVRKQVNQNKFSEERTALRKLNVI